MLADLKKASRGGFARVDDDLLEFIQDSEAACGLPLEPLYTAKAMIALGSTTPGYPAPDQETAPR